MVSGHIFHCRRNSWPAEEYVGRTALQLVSPVSARSRLDRGELFCFPFRVVCGWSPAPVV
jgi:hypothetical protein